MKYIDAIKLTQDQEASDEKFVLAASFDATKIKVYFDAYSLIYSRKLSSCILPYGMLAIHLQKTEKKENTISIITPWDLLPQLDWRAGGGELIELERSKEVIKNNYDLIEKKSSKIIYLKLPTYPLFNSDIERSEIDYYIDNLISLNNIYTINAHLQVNEYYGSGSLMLLEEAEHIAQYIHNYIAEIKINKPYESLKVLITDFDNVLWSGVISEDGINNINYRNEGVGWPHYSYQSLLKSLSKRGVLLVGLTRNSLDNALQVLNNPSDSILKSEDFVKIVGTYGSKASEIKKIAKQFNLALSSILFIDDNPAEIVDVSKSVPEVKVLIFQNNNIELFPKFLRQVTYYFNTNGATNEDFNRLNYYRNKILNLNSFDQKLGNITEYLSTLDMTLTIESLNEQNKIRALQLINKTNQFNLNGIRFDESAFARKIANGLRIYIASVKDTNLDHGKISVIGVNLEGVVELFVMSCRVFQRHIEYAFLKELIKIGVQIKNFDFIETSKNRPIANFINEIKTKDISKYNLSNSRLKNKNKNIDKIIKTVKIIK